MTDRTYTTAVIYKNMDNAMKAVGVFGDHFIIRKRTLASGRVKVYYYEPGFTRLK